MWDWKRKKIAVLDPKDMHLGSSYLQSKHDKTLVLMQSGMKECYEDLLHETYYEKDSWESEYIGINGGQVDRYHN